MVVAVVEEVVEIESSSSSVAAAVVVVEGRRWRWRDRPNKVRDQVRAKIPMWVW